MSYHDYPNEPIGGGNPYYRCSYCKVSDPEINGRLEGHRRDCEYRRNKEQELLKRQRPPVSTHPLVIKSMQVAAIAHAGQLRKGTDIPYIVHPLHVGQILLEAGADPEVVAAGNLHDTDEDTNFKLSDTRSQFGDRVARLVGGASEPDKSASWEERKRHTLDYLKTAPLDERWVACADKLSNSLSLLDDLERYGESVWSRFNRGQEDQAWYYKGLVESLFHGLEEDDIPPFFLEFERVVGRVFDMERNEME